MVLTYSPSLVLKVYKDSICVRTFKTKKRRKAFDYLQANKCKKYRFYLMVNYSKSYWNETPHKQSWTNIILAYKAFLDRDLLDEFTHQ